MFPPCPLSRKANAGRHGGGGMVSILGQFEELTYQQNGNIYRVKFAQNLSSGVYILLIQTETKTITVKLVVTNEK